MKDLPKEEKHMRTAANEDLEASLLLWAKDALPRNVTQSEPIMTTKAK